MFVFYALFVWCAWGFWVSVSFFGFCLGCFLVCLFWLVCSFVCFAVFGLFVVFLVWFLVTVRLVDDLQVCCLTNSNDIFVFWLWVELLIGILSWFGLSGISVLYFCFVVIVLFWVCALFD